MLYFLPATRLLKVLPFTIMGQVLHCLLLYAIFPALIGEAGVVRFALTSKSLRFGGLPNPTNGGLRMACLSLFEVWRMDRCSLASGVAPLQTGLARTLPRTCLRRKGGR